MTETLPTFAPGVADAAEAYVWGYPLVVMHRTRALLCSRTPPGTLSHRDGLATAADKAVVAPNNDTLYSTGWYDLRAGDLRIDVPAMDHAERYWSVMLLDAYTNVAYVCRRLHGVDGATVRVTFDPSREPTADNLGVIPVGTPTVWALVRVLVDDEADLAAARAVQQAITITAPEGHPHSLTERLGRPNQAHTAGAGFFDELAAAMAIDPPAGWHPRLSPGAARVATGEHSLSAAELQAGVDAGEAELRARGLRTDMEGNGWGTRRTGTDFRGDIMARAVAAKYALAGHHPVENRGYVAQHDGAGQPLDGERGLVLRFPPGGEPPCDGFWSLTVYQPDMYFYDNEIDRWAVGDRTAGLERDPDGGLTLTIGGPRPETAANWLPAPAGPYQLALRVYEGRPDVVDASWFPPPLVPDGQLQARGGA